MSSQIIFFRKNWADFERPNVVVTASEGQATAVNVLDRSNRSAWGTSGSTDASNTTFIVDAGDTGLIDSILLLKHNFKNFLLEYWDDVNGLWLGFATPLHPVNNTALSSYFNFPQITTSKIKLTIFGTMVADSDKILSQFIFTSQIGKLEGWPVIAKPVLGRTLIQNQVLSGKAHLIQNLGAYTASLEVTNWSSAKDLAIVEALYAVSEGFLYWPCGGDELQFKSVRIGYRLEDIFLCRAVNEYSPPYVMGLYKSGMNIQIDLAEVIT